MAPDHAVRIHARKPPWLKRRIPSGASFRKIHGILKEWRLHTVCQEAHCPNLGECFSNGTATFIILGDQCTRNCRFCAVSHGPTMPPDPEEPRRVSEAVSGMRLDYVVITSVTRDDLPDGGAGHFARTIREIRRVRSKVVIEVLIPDFQGSENSLETVVEAQPDVLNHNLETVPRIYPRVRPGADYVSSLNLFKRVRNLDHSLTTKSGLMLGLGERPPEITAVLEDLIKVNCRILTLGQYLQPSEEHLPVERYIPPDEFDEWRKTALKMGFDEVASGPFVRSSYRAHELFQK